MASYSARPGSGQRAQRAWDVLAARYPKMQPVKLVSELKGALGWQWSMEFRSPGSKSVFWDSISVAEIRALVADQNKKKRASGPQKLSVVKRKKP